MPAPKKPASDAEQETKDTEVLIVGEGAFIAPAGSDVRRPYGHGARVKVANDIAEQLVADGVARVATSDGSVVVVVADVTPSPNALADADA